jgi:RNA polymerase sigma-70 factor (ECF subfamily)
MSTETSPKELVASAICGDVASTTALRERCEPQMRSLIEAELPAEFCSANCEPPPHSVLLLDAQCGLLERLKKLSCEADHDFEEVFDASLIALVKDGVFFWLVERVRSRLMAYICKAMPDYLRGQDAAGDIWNDTLSTAKETYDTFVWQGEEAFASWLFTIAKGKIRDRVKYENAAKRDHHRTIGNPPADDGSSSGLLDKNVIDTCTPGQGLRRRERAEKLRATMSEVLTPLEELAVKLCYFEQMTAEEAARQMGISRTYVTTLTDRARQKLRRALTESSALRPSS